MLGSDEVVTDPPRFLERDFDYSFDPRRGDDLVKDDSLIAAEHRLDRLSNLADVNSQVLQRLLCNSIAFTHKAKEQMLGAYIALVRALGLLLGECQHFLGPLAESLEGIHGSLASRNL